MADIQPIETIYRGYRFRSRLEARWAVFFDASGIKWSYENEGYKVNGRGYLPDFWLPELEAFVETKPHDEACKQAEPLLRELVHSSGKRALLIAGTPSIDELPTITLLQNNQHKTCSAHSAWRQCPYCNRVLLRGIVCPCIPPSITVVRAPSAIEFPRVEHAMEQAQGARFEHGEDGRPEPWVANIATAIERVYVAGAVLDQRRVENDGEDGKTVSYLETHELPWRSDIFGKHEFDADNRIRYRGRFEYAGPTILKDHGIAYQDLASNCLAEVEHSDSMFVWIDRPHTVGTIAEIGAAYAWRKPIFIAFAGEWLYEQFYFVDQLATVTVIALGAVAAWEFFVRWRKCSAP